MDKQTLTGLVLIGIIFLGFTWYGNIQQEKIVSEKTRIDSINRVELEKTARELALNQPATSTIENTDSVINASRVERAKNTLGEILFEAQNTTPENYTIQNDKIVVGITTKGATVNSVMLKDYNTWDGKPLYIFSEQSSVFDLVYRTNLDINSSLFNFSSVTDKKDVVVDSTPGSIKFRLYNDSLSYIEYVYTLTPGSYELGLAVNLVGMDQLLDPRQSDFTIKWASDALQSEKGYDYENQYTTLAYNQPLSDNVEEFSIGDSKQETVNTKIKWVAFKQQFFSSIFIAKDDFLNGDLSYQTLTPGSGELKHFEAILKVPYSTGKSSYDFSFYFGPNSYNIMKSYDQNFQKLIPLGWGILGWINRFIVIPTFDFLSKYIANFGWIILLLTIFIKLIIFPFTYKSYISMAKMRLLKPDIDALAEKFPKKEQAMQKQQATMELYGRAGVSPMGGCLPMLFQLPILIAMFRFFPASIELRGEHFLWATDLSSYDSILTLPFTIPFYGDHVSLFAILMGVSMYVASKINLAQSGAASSQQIPGMTFMTLYIMPIMLVVWFNNYSSGLSYYYFLSNLITIGQTFIIRRFVDDKKLHLQMKSNAKKPRKKSKWQAKYEDMLKQQQQQQPRKK